MMSVLLAAFLFLSPGEDGGLAPVMASAEYFRRRCGFLAFQGGADGVWTDDAMRQPYQFCDNT